jgi:hypothetical protein
VVNLSVFTNSFQRKLRIDENSSTSYETGKKGWENGYHHQRQTLYWWRTVRISKNIFEFASVYKPRYNRWGSIATFLSESMDISESNRVFYFKFFI